MNRKWIFVALLCAAIPTLAFGQAEALNPAQLRIQKEVRHELLMLPYFGVFDNISYQVQGSTVSLFGDVTRPTLKSDAGNVVKHIEGVDQVVNKINVLPLRDTHKTVSRDLRVPVYGKICSGRAEADSNYRQQRPGNAHRSGRLRG
jgi:hyperosmotically inducible protein